MHKRSAEDVGKAVIRLKVQVGDDLGVYHVGWGDRYGQLVLTVECISRSDELRIKKLLPTYFDGIGIHTMAPIWRSGELLPELGAQFDSMLSVPANVATPKGQEETSRFLGKLMEAEDKCWQSLSPSAQRAFIARRIADRRRGEPGFANCGDKFLQH
jgi:hypothetical protein